MVASGQHHLPRLGIATRGKYCTFGPR